MPKDLTAAELAPGDADFQNATDALSTAFRMLESRARAEIAWYFGAKRVHAVFSKTLRILALIAGGLGGLAPLLAGMMTQPAGSPAAVPAVPVHDWLAHLDRLGYVLIAAAGGLVLFDRVFGFSSSYRRYVVTGLSLQRALAAFQVDWVVLGIQLPTSLGATFERRMARLIEFRTQMITLLERETQDWASELERSVREIESLSQAKREEPRPGVIEVTLANVQPDEAVELLVDGASRGTTQGSAKAQLQAPPGQHVVVATRGGREASASAVLVLGPGETVAVSLSFPP